MLFIEQAGATEALRQAKEAVEYIFQYLELGEQ